MIAIGVAGLVAFLVFLYLRFARRPRTGPEPAQDAESGTTVESPSAVRLLGLLLLALAFLVLNWLYVAKAQQFTLMMTAIYPAGLAVALVLLFDKATRSWSVKSRLEGVREWMYCDVLVFLYLLGFLNLLSANGGENYHVLFWDLLHIVSFLFVFWMVDRKFTRLRFLVAQGYMILLPILLLIWRVLQEVETPDDQSWWSSIWPFFYLAIIAFVLEVIALLATRESKSQVLQTIKDFLFIALYAILLIVAIP